MVNQLKDTAKEGLQFSKQLASVVVAFSLLGLGAYSVYQGRDKISLMLGSVALIFSGVLTGVVGIALLYKTLMRKEAKEA